MLLIIIICLLLLFAFYFILINPIKKDSIEDSNSEDVKSDKSKYIFSFYQKIPNKKVISCDCKECQTWHTGQVQHKMICPIFRKKNPDLTFGEFMEYEGFGFSGVNDMDWPPFKMEYPQLKSPMPTSSS